MLPRRRKAALAAERAEGRAQKKKDMWQQGLCPARRRLEGDRKGDCLRYLIDSGVTVVRVPVSIITCEGAFFCAGPVA